MEGTCTRVLQRSQIQQDTERREKRIYYKELAHAVVEALKSQSLLSAS